MQVPRTHRPALKMEDAVAHLEGLGVSTDGIRGRATTRKRGRSLGPSGEEGEDGDEEDGGKKVRHVLLLLLFVLDRVVRVLALAVRSWSHCSRSC